MCLLITCRECFSTYLFLLFPSLKHYCTQVTVSVKFTVPALCIKAHCTHHMRCGSHHSSMAAAPDAHTVSALAVAWESSHPCKPRQQLQSSRRAFNEMWPNRPIQFDSSLGEPWELARAWPTYYLADDRSMLDGSDITP